MIFEKGILGGIAQVGKHYAKVDDKYMKEQHNSDEASIYLQYLDANNLYGWEMIQKLPTHGFVWDGADNFTFGKIDKLVKTDKKGYILEVDVEYPKELHKNPNELRPLMERMKIRKVVKLVPNFKDKKT